MSANASNFKLKFSRWGATLLVLVFGIQTYSVVSLCQELKQVNAAVLEQARCDAVIAQASALSKLFYDAGVAMGGYSITKNKEFGERYAKITSQIPLDLAELKKLEDGKPEARASLERIESLVEGGLDELAKAKVAIDENRVDVAQFRARHMYKQVRQDADKIQDELRGLTEGKCRVAKGESPGPHNMTVYLGAISVLVFGIVLDAVKNSGATRQVE